MSNATRLIFTTPLEEELARASLPWLPRGSVIPLGADGPPPTPEEDLSAAFLARYPLARDRRRLIFLGRLHPKKGLGRMLAVLPQIVSVNPKVLLIISGSGEQDYLDQLQEEVRAADLTGHVLFTGLVQGEAKWQALAAAEIFVLPSHQENFAIAAAEAMHSGLPVILSDKVNLWPFVEEAQAGIVLADKDLPAALSEAVIGLLNDDERRAEMGDRGKRFAAREFTWRTAAEKTQALYCEILGQDGQSHAGLAKAYSRAV